jgi:hypothetical protein
MLLHRLLDEIADLRQRRQCGVEGPLLDLLVAQELGLELLEEPLPLTRAVGLLEFGEELFDRSVVVLNERVDRGPSSSNLRDNTVPRGRFRLPP